jgi:hypothetical protein
MTTQLFVSAASALLLAIALVGCDAGSSPASLTDSSELAFANPAPLARPLTGRCETTFMLHPTQPPPPVVRQIDEGTCRLAHLGRATFYSDKEINFATGIQVTTEASFTAATGDILYAVGSGTSAVNKPGEVDFWATLTFVGGTGRFTNASGHANVQGTAFLATHSAKLEIVEGSIYYDASNRSGL